MYHLTVLNTAMAMETEHNILHGENSFCLNIYTSLNQCFMHFYFSHNL